MKTIVFLHIPKTAGQTVHSELERIVGADKTSPVRVNSQSDVQYPKGYSLYSGHLDWDTLAQDIPADERFTFSVLRDPFERIGSFYFYNLKRAERLTPKELEAPARRGLKAILEQSVDDYFLSGDPKWKKFIRNYYDNFYCQYFATGRMRGQAAVRGMTKPELIDKALAGVATLDKVYALENLSALEADIKDLTGETVSLSKKRVNAGPQPAGEKRWDSLLDRLERDANREKMEKLGVFDRRLMNRIKSL